MAVTTAVEPDIEPGFQGFYLWFLCCFILFCLLPSGIEFFHLSIYMLQGMVFEWCGDGLIPVIHVTNT